MNAFQAGRTTLFVLLVAGAGNAAAAASGNVKFHGESWKVADALAYAEGDETHVVLGAAAFDRKAYAKDGKLDTFDFMRQGLSTLTLKIGADGTMNCVDFANNRGGGSSCGSIGEGLKLSKRTAGEIAGTLKHASGEDQLDVQFQLAIESKTLARAGQPLPAGGGDAGKALTAIMAAIQSGDLKKIKAVSHPERIAQIEESEKAGEAQEMVEMMKAFTPTVTKIPGGMLDGDSATLDFIGTMDGQPTKGTITMERVGGKWYMKSISSSGG